LPLQFVPRSGISVLALQLEKASQGVVIASSCLVSQLDKSVFPEEAQ
jgi:hypothetical protein